MSHIDPWIQQAVRNIHSDYGVRVSLEAKCKDLFKFGRNLSVTTAPATLMTLPDGVDHETYVSTNIITHIVSDNAGDTEPVVIEGHTIANGEFTFVVQTVTLTGQTAVALTTPLARVSRAYANGSTDLVGAIYVHQSDTVTAGVPQTDTQVHLMIRAGSNQSEKCSTTLSSTDYWVVTSFYGDVFSKQSGTFGQVDLGIRLAGKVFRQIADLSISDAHRGIHEFHPYLVIPANSDIRLTAISDSVTGRDLSGSIEGTLLTVR